jgi:hypothetical protein
MPRPSLAKLHPHLNLNSLTINFQKTIHVSLWQQQRPVKLVSKYSTACLLNSEDIQFVQQRIARLQLSARDKRICVISDVIDYGVILHVPYVIMT